MKVHRDSSVVMQKRFYNQLNLDDCDSVKELHELPEKDIKHYQHYPGSLVQPGCKIAVSRRGFDEPLSEGLVMSVEPVVESREEFDKGDYKRKCTVLLEGQLKNVFIRDNGMYPIRFSNENTQS